MLIDRVRQTISKISENAYLLISGTPYKPLSGAGLQGLTVRALIVDKNPSRRASVSRAFLDCGWHAEIFESVEEFRAFEAKDGLVLAYDAPGADSAVGNMGRWKGSGCLPVVMYSDNVVMEHVIRAILAGALDYLRWPIAAADIDRLKEDVAPKAESRRREEMVKFEARELVQNLSPREKEILALMAHGYSNKRTANELGISHRTVEIHRANAFKKINAGSTADAVRIAVYAGLDQVD